MNYDSALILNAWMLPSAIRHEVIFRVLHALPLLQSVTLINDHDPKPLFYQLEAENPGMFHPTSVDLPKFQYFAVVITRQPVAGDLPLL